MEKTLKYTPQIYTELLKRYGPRGWWPVTPANASKGDRIVSPIYGISLKNEKQKFEIIVGAILTQNTAWKNVEKAIVQLNKKNLMSIPGILQAKHEELAQAIKSSGYFNQKAKKLKNIALFLTRYPIPTLQKMEISHARKLLLDVNGVGPETADSILLYALDKPAFVIDSYTKRVFSRICFEGKTYDEFQALFMNTLKHDFNVFNEYHALIVELSKSVCLKKPLCQKCPLNKLCEKKL